VWSRSVQSVLKLRINAVTILPIAAKNFPELPQFYMFVENQLLETDRLLHHELSASVSHLSALSNASAFYLFTN
jgi:hypothetical protein